MSAGASTGGSLEAPLELRARPNVLRTLQHAGAGGAHAWLLAGDDQAGLRAAANWIAGRAICPAGGGDGCDVCARVARGVHPDVHHVRAEGVALAVEQVRSLVEQLVRRPFEAAAQVAIIDDADSLDATNPVAGNALLKVLEEPPGPVVFVLLARRVARLLPTIRSRVVEVALPPLAEPALTELLRERGVDPVAAGWNASHLHRVARGDAARALELVESGPVAARRAVALAVGEGLAGRTLQPIDAAQALLERCEAAGADAGAAATAEFERMLETMSEQEARRFRSTADPDGMEKRVNRRVRRATSRELDLLLDELMLWYRDLLAARAGVPGVVVNVDRLDAVQRLAASPAAERAVAGLDALEECQLRVRSNAEQKLAVEAVCAELASLAEGRVRARRTVGLLSRTTQNYELAVH